jgi:hypothetical protein
MTTITPDTKRALHLQILQTVKRIESWDLAARSGLMANTSNKYVKYLRDDGHNILTEDVDGKDNCRYVYVSGPGNPTPLRQVDKPCPVCGSFYRRGTKCNICGKES